MSGKLVTITLFVVLIYLINLLYIKNNISKNENKIFIKCQYKLKSAYLNYLIRSKEFSESPIFK